MNTREHKGRFACLGEQPGLPESPRCPARRVAEWKLPLTPEKNSLKPKEPHNKIQSAKEPPKKHKQNQKQQEQTPKFNPPPPQSQPKANPKPAEDPAPAGVPPLPVPETSSGCQCLEPPANPSASGPSVRDRDALLSVCQ